MNPKRLKQTIMGGLIGVLALWLALDRWLPDVKPAQAVAAAAVARPPTAPENLPSTDRGASEQDRTRWAQTPWPPDPFYRDRPDEPRTKIDSADGTERSRYVLSAIVAGRRPLALINGAYLGIDDRLTDGSRIQSIGENSVTLQGPDGPWSLTFPE